MSASPDDREPVIELHDVALCYRLARQRIHSFKEYFVHMVSGGLSYHELWALDGIDLTVYRGESVGICGHNGAGKSTLSKLVSGIFKPTRGTRTVRGRVAPILELGIGFDPELTGLENIYMNSLFFGHRRREVEERLDAIIEFSGLGDFIESPVRNYSTGMTARLAFSIATAWVPDVLILDEVLAVGDARFLQRCHDRIAEFREQGATTLIVSHSPTAILDNCSRAIWIDRGKKRADGDPAEVLGLYAESDRPGRVVPEEEEVHGPRL